MIATATGRQPFGRAGYVHPALLRSLIAAMPEVPNSASHPGGGK